MENGSIYCIKNKINDKLYIGSTNDHVRREREHLSYLRNNKHHAVKLQRAYNKYGKSNFEFILLEECDVNILLNREQYYINEYKPFYNSLKIAGGFLGYNHPKESSLTHSERAKKQWENYTEKQKEEKLKYFKEYSENLKGKNLPENIKLKISKSAIINKAGKRLSEIKRKMIEEGIYKYNAMPISQFDLSGNFIQDFNSVKDAANFCKVNHSSHIIRCCKNIKPTAYGFIWKYKNN